MSNPGPKRPWHREPMLWLVIALPMAAVLAGFTTLTIAIRSGGGDSVPDPVRRTLQIQDTDLDADRAALAAALQGELRIEAGTGAVQVRLSGLGGIEPRLRLRLQHAGRAARDQEIELVSAGNVWVGRVENSAGQVWNLELSAPDGAWRLGGRLEPDSFASPLRPLLAGG
jgi:hypothetical protein